MPVRKRTSPRRTAVSRAHADKLSRIGMSRGEARAKGAMFQSCDEALDTLGTPGKRWSLWVPGRIEVLGKHTDYAGGRSLLCATEYGVCLAAAPRTDAQVVVRDLRKRPTVTAALDPSLAVPARGWANYVMTVTRRLSRNFPDARRGADVVLASDLPAASGLSSSSALMVSLFLALAEINGLLRDAA